MTKEIEEIKLIRLMEFHNSIDTDKLKRYLNTHYRSIRHFSYLLWRNYEAIISSINWAWWKYISEKLMDKIINKINDWITFEGEVTKPINKKDLSYFIKK